MLHVDTERCQGARGLFAHGVNAGAMPVDCVKCARRTDIVPGHAHKYIQAPTWLPLMECPKRIEPVAEDAA